jgi:cobalt-zinc-cadmium resistance protein CzcA
VRGDIAIKLYGDDLDAMSATGAKVAAVLNTVPGAADVKVEQTEGFPQLDVKFDRDAIARYGLTLQDVTDTVAAALGGREAGIVFEGDRRFDIVVRLPNAGRDDLDAVGACRSCCRRKARRFPLSAVASFGFSEGLNQVSRDNGQRRVVVQANVRGNDLGSFIAEAQSKVAAQVQLPPGSFIEWGGQFENLQAASRRLSLVIPIVFRGDLRHPVCRLARDFGRRSRSIRRSLGAGGRRVRASARWIALLGIGSSRLHRAGGRRRLERPGRDDRDQPADRGRSASRAGNCRRLARTLPRGADDRDRSRYRLCPDGAGDRQGAEVQKPLAIVVIGGLITSTILTLFVLPAISQLLLKGKHKHHETGEYSDVDTLGSELPA